MKKVLWVAVAGASAFATQVTAQSVAPIRQLDSVIVTATGQASAVRDVQASVEVVEREELERHGDGTVTQALKHSAGVQTASNGATGSIAVRGFNTNHTLVLVDGFRRTNNYGGSNPAQLSFFDIERIEIVRGPLSSLYGSEALGGVVNVITRHPGAAPGSTVYVQAGGSEHGRESLRSGLNVRTGNDELGHSFTIEQDYRDAMRYRGSVEDDRGRLNNRAGSYRGRWSPDATRSVGWALEVFDRDGRTRVDDPAGNYERIEDERRYFGSLDYRQMLGEGELVLRASAGQSKGEAIRSYPTVERTEFRQYQGDGVYHFSLHDSHLVSIGAGALRDEIDVSIHRRKASRSNYFVLAQDQWQINSQWQLVAGARFDRFNDFGNTVNPRISLGWSRDAWSARVGYGTAFRAPSLGERYALFTRGTGARASTIRGNPDLKPEESSTWEAMLRREFARGHVELTVHRNRIKQLIETVRVSTVPSVLEYRNVQQAMIDGAELMASWRFGQHWSLSGGVDVTDARNANTGERLTGRAERVWRLELIHARGPWETSLRALRLENILEAGTSAPRGSPPYNSNLTRFDLGVSYAWSSNVKLTAGIENLFDKREPDNVSGRVLGGDLDARYAYLGVRIDF
jgi:outer membrane receptor for ferrienterochelin and colicins